MNIKKYIKLLVPPVFLYLFNRLPIYNFKKFWKKIENSPKLDAELKDITNKFLFSSSYNFVSQYWHYYNVKNFKQLLNEGGLENYSNTVAKNYYTFLLTSEEQIRNAIKNVENDNINIKTKLFKKHNNLSYYESYFYNCLLLLLYENLKKTSSFKLLNQLSDSAFLGFGDPFLEINGVKITHDKINSLIDYDKIKRIDSFSNFSNILEIGAGSGRTSEIINSFHKNLHYVICDIPPAIYISYKRLKKAFPNKNISKLFEINNGIELQESIKSNDISFIFPHQMKLLDKKFFQLVLAVDCMHEMDKKTINYYFELIDKNSNYFYFSVWEKTRVAFSNSLFSLYGDRLDFNKKDYPINPNWSCVFKENSIFPGNYLCLCYKIK